MVQHMKRAWFIRSKATLRGHCESWAKNPVGHVRLITWCWYHQTDMTSLSVTGCWGLIWPFTFEKYFFVCLLPFANRADAVEAKIWDIFGSTFRTHIVTMSIFLYNKSSMLQTGKCMHMIRWALFSILVQQLRKLILQGQKSRKTKIYG
jgi:hypothetical protein